MEKKSIPRELMVLPIFETVLFPHMSTRRLIVPQQEQRLSERMKENSPFVIGLTVRGVGEPSRLQESSFYRVGTLVRLDSIQHTEKGDLLFLTALKRIQIDRMTMDENGIRATYTFLNDQSDLDENS